MATAQLLMLTVTIIIILYLIIVDSELAIELENVPLIAACMVLHFSTNTINIVYYDEAMLQRKNISDYSICKPHVLWRLWST